MEITFPPSENVRCTSCQEIVMPDLLDHGIGNYEYWGRVGKDIALLPTCPKCGGVEFHSKDGSIIEFNIDYSEYLL